MPVRWILNGDRNLAAVWRGEGQRMLWLVHNIKATSGIDVYHLSRTMPDKTTIKASSVFDIDIVQIDAVSGGQVKREKEKRLLVFLWNAKESLKNLFYAIKLPDLTLVRKPSGFNHTDYSGGVAYDFPRGTGRTSHNLNLAIPYSAWDDVADDSGLLPIRVYWNIPATCYHSHIRGGSEALIWGTCGYDGDAIMPPLASMQWPFRSVLPFPALGKKKTLNPTQAIYVVVPYGDGYAWQELPQLTGADHGISGKQNFSLIAGSQKAESWLDTLQVSGVGTLASSGVWDPDGYPSGGYPAITWGWYPYPSPGWFFKPWYPWLHENPSFDLFPADTFASADASIDDLWDLEPRNPYRYQRKFIDAGGNHADANAFVETADYKYTTSSTSPYTDIGNDGRCVGEYYHEGASWILETTPGSYGGTASGTIYNPIACLGGDKYLFLESVFTASGLHSGSGSLGSWHDDNWPCGAIYCGTIGGFCCFVTDMEGNETPTGYLYWWRDWVGSRAAHNSAFSFRLNQSLKFDTTEIENPTSQYDYLLTVAEESTAYSHSQARKVKGEYPYEAICTLQDWEYGNETIKTRTDAEQWLRTLNFVEVLDYDNQGTDTAIVIYKKVSITHTAGFDYSAEGTGGLPGGYASETSNFTWNGTRTVMYWLWYKIGASVWKVQLTPTFSGTASGSFGTAHSEIQTGAGQRIYGVSCQVNPDYIVFSYQVEDFTTLPLGSYGFYSSPINFEDRNYLGPELTGSPAWNKNKMVLGCINVSDPKFPVGQKWDKDIPAAQYADPEVFTVGIHQEEREYEVSP